MKKNGKKGSKLALRLVCVLMLAALLCGMGLPAGAEEEPAVTEPVITEQPAAETPVVTGGEESAEPDVQESTDPAGEPAEEEENTPVLSEVPGVDEAEIAADASALEEPQADSDLGIMLYASDTSETEGALVYFLVSPTSNPESNVQGNWSDIVGEAVVQIPDNAQWEKGDKGSTQNLLLSKDSNLPTYILEWPDGSQDTTWTLNRSDYYDFYVVVYNNYKEQLKKDLGITDLKLEDIEEITLTPYKISKGNGTDPDKHIDCKVSIKCSKAYVAQFNVQMPGNDGYTIVYSENKKIVNSTAEAIGKYTNNDKVPETIVDKDITYRFDGWYNEAGEKVADWPYTPTADELDDGTVNFYAHYVPATTSITVTKKVSGNMGDVNKEFNFTYSYTGIDGSQITGSFNLKNGDTSDTISNIPIGTVLTLTETGADGYETSATYGEKFVKAENGDMTFTIAESGGNIIVTNEKEVTIDTGVSLDTLPYVLLLGGMAVLGGALLLRRKVTRA